VDGGLVRHRPPDSLACSAVRFGPIIGDQAFACSSDETMLAHDVDVEIGTCHPPAMAEGASDAAELQPTGHPGDDVVLSEVRGDGVALLTLHRPARLNAWTLAMEDRYFDLLLAADADDAVRAIVVTGAGRGFSPGVDLGGPGSSNHDDPRLYGSISRRPTTLPLTVRKPLIAAINGPVAGVSLVQTLQCDLRFAATGVKMAFAFPRRGLVAEYGVSWLLPRLIGTSRALDLLLSGRVVTSEEALALGLINRIVPAEQLVDEAIAYAADLAANCSPASMAVIKQQIYADWENDLETARVRVAGLMSASLDGPDFREGVASFLEKRRPAFAPLGKGSNSSLEPDQDGQSGVIVNSGSPAGRRSRTAALPKTSSCSNDE